MAVPLPMAANGDMVSMTPKSWLCTSPVRSLFSQEAAGGGGGMWAPQGPHGYPVYMNAPLLTLSLAPGHHHRSALCMAYKP